MEPSPIALITGGTRNIGLSIALGLAEDGFTPIVTYRKDRTAAEAALERLRALAPKALALQADATVPAAAENVVRLIRDQFGRLDVLVNNVGPFLARSVVEMSVAEWRMILDGNLSSAFYYARAVLPLMRQQQHGVIINMGSLNAELARGAPTVAAYNAAKAGLVVLTRSLARSEGPYGIRVNIVNPGFIETDSTTEADRQELPPIIPLRRLGRPEDVTAAVRYLVSDAAAYVTGAVINVAGGLWV
ncbi:MAG: SDR family oxidoreductase [Chloroflexi bacterium]|nr:MAG: SDR family oxidoreductase [Chloroflexota bacterium]